MYLKPADPDLQTLFQRIRGGDLDLQPEFQRGEVWSEPKRQRLIDSILREWQVPPVHVVVDAETNSQSVLDGQQRLAAIRDFFENRLTINGHIEPSDRDIERLHGLSFQELPLEVRRKVERYSIRVFYISDYSPEEPGELFFRLNQNSALSPAEQRNAFFGQARRQVKGFVGIIEDSDMQRAYFGFSNARMAYDDIIAKSLFILETGSLVKKATSTQLVDRYRSLEGFSNESMKWFEDGLRLLSSAVPYLYATIRLNKATALTWLVFAARVSRHAKNSQPKPFADFLCQFEIRRARRDQSEAESWSAKALSIYDDRASARVGDVSSVVLRDFVLWLHFVEFVRNEKKTNIFDPFGASEYSFDALSKAESGADIEALADSLNWGHWL